MIKQIDAADFEGMVSAEEVALLQHFGATLKAGCIVEIGSWRGKSAIAFALGAAEQEQGCCPKIYCVDPHETTTGVYGGRFGPADRTAFYKAMLAAGCSELVSLINLPSLDAAKGWNRPIGILFLDGDHTENAVQADVDAWSPHVVDGGYIMFDDAFDPAIGPFHVIQKLISKGNFVHVANVGKISILQRLASHEEGPKSQICVDVRDRVGAHAIALGYNADAIIERLEYGSFVSIERRYVFIETPKAACTAFKKLISNIEGVRFDFSNVPYHRETRLDMFIHQRRHVGVPTFLELELSMVNEILGRSSDWFVFAMCRNPFSRIVSVFENKIRLGEPGYRDLASRYGNPRHFGSISGAFRAFVSNLISDKSEILNDPHFRPQSELLFPDLIPYTKIFRIEDIDEALSAFHFHLIGMGWEKPLFLDRVNSSHPRNWRAFYDSITAARVADLYSNDFREFGYDPDNWRPTEGDSTMNAEVIESKCEGFWREEIVARNELIDFLYDLLENSRKR